MIKVKQFLHTSVNVAADPDQGIEFYGKFLGLDAAPRPDIPGTPGAWWQVGDSQVHIIGRSQTDQPLDAARAHFALGVESLAEAKQALESAGIAYRESAGRVGTTQVFFNDPFGNLIELQEV